QRPYLAYMAMSIRLLLDVRGVFRAVGVVGLRDDESRAHDALVSEESVEALHGRVIENEVSGAAHMYSLHWPAVLLTTDLILDVCSQDRQARLPLRQHWQLFMIPGLYGCNVRIANCGALQCIGWITGPAAPVCDIK
ncbi:hypothetical protein, partial [Streptomyces sp. BF23-30]|uniref:hypothetical protein n=1 Tax=Streptomyces sp. BF23-30 TaxID=3240281 RepID=UPI0034E4350C